MSKLVSYITLGIDVSKDELVICHWETEQLTTVRNASSALNAWLQSLHGPVRIALEPTSHYHLAVVEHAHALGMEVYLVNPRQLLHYRQAVNVRNKTDPKDAWLLARYLAHEAGSLRRFKPLDAQAQQLWALLKRRASAVKARQQLQQSFAEIKLSIKALFTEIEHLLARIDKRLKVLVRALGWWDDYQRCLTIPGIGPLNAAALVAVYHRGVFASSDAFVAFIGLDVRLRESGKYQGRRKLTKCGEAEIRRLLYCAAKPARSYSPFADYHQQQLNKGLPKIAANVILARKLARIAFTLINNKQNFKKQEIAYSQSP